MVNKRQERRPKILSIIVEFKKSISSFGITQDLVFGNTLLQPWYEIQDPPPPFSSQTLQKCSIHMQHAQRVARLHGYQNVPDKRLPIIFTRSYKKLNLIRIAHNGAISLQINNRPKPLIKFVITVIFHVPSCFLLASVFLRCA